MIKTPVIGVMGGGVADPDVKKNAYDIGSLIAKQRWILLTGGRNAGVMAESARGAFENGGLTVGVLPGIDTSDASPHISIPICTGMGNARNCINVLSSDIVVACRGGYGTLSEIALALKSKKPVILLDFENACFPASGDSLIFHAATAEEAVGIIKGILSGNAGQTP